MDPKTITDLIALAITLLIIAPLFWKLFKKLNRMDDEYYNKEN